MKEMTRSPAWFVPVLRLNTSPHLGRLFDGRVSITSLANAMVSPT